MTYGNKSKTETFVLTLPLVTHMHDEAYLEDTFNRYWHAYNWLVAKTLNEWHQVRKLRQYKQLTEKIYSHDLLTAVLRDEWGYDGIVMTDWYAANSIMAAGCVKAGIDITLPA